MSLNEIVNTTIFGKTMDLIRQPAEEGVSKHRIFSKDFGHVPGSMKHWTFELERRKKDIQEYNDSQFMRRAMALIGKKEDTAVTGRDLAKYVGPKNEQKKNVMLANLGKNPTEALARITLAVIAAEPDRIYMEDGRNNTCEVHRLALLHATVACMLGTFNAKYLMAVLTIQYNYLERLRHKCFDDLAKLDAYYKSREGNEKFEAQIKSLEARIRRTMNYIAALQSLSNPSKLKHMDQGEYILTLEELKNIKFEGNDKKDDKRKLIMNKSIRIISILKNMPLLLDEGHKLVDPLMQLEPNSPIPFFLKARLEKSKMLFANAQYEAGDQRKEIAKTIEESFRKAFTLYGKAKNIIGNRAANNNECTILYEFAELPLFFYKIAPQMHLNLPKAWVNSVLKQSQKTLTIVSASNPGTPGLMQLQTSINEIVDGE
ncbi:MAG: hypothetical protein HQM12_12195 [SAR324 cluster bacterium]|nr:hypothetical protein [SAR324 cluster bacterium]